MSRIRSLKPEFGQSEKLSAEHSEVHLLAALLLPYADDEGYFNANPKLIQSACCPLRELFVSVPEILVRLMVVGYIEILDGTDGRKYGHIVNFLIHQRVTHPSPSKIRLLVSPPENIVKPLEPLVSPPESFRPDLELNRKGMEGEAALPPLIFSDLKPIEAARMYLQHEDINWPVTRFNLTDIESGLKAIVLERRIGVMDSLEWLLEQARKCKAAGKKPGPEWVRKAGYNDADKKQVRMASPDEIQRQAEAESLAWEVAHGK